MAFYTLVERKWLGVRQWRKGPDKLAFQGWAQPLADAAKLFLKGAWGGPRVNPAGYTVSAVGSLFLALLMWGLHPSGGAGGFTALAFLLLRRLSVYCLLGAGWFSNGKYRLLGTLRGVAQTVSYEVTLALYLFAGLVVVNGYRWDKGTRMLSWGGLLLPGVFLGWGVAVVAETNRAPFDLVEGESELVSGYNVEYGGGLFATLFMAEYCNILITSLFTASLFAGGCWRYAVGGVVFACVVLAARAALPRLRYDRLMGLTWLVLLPRRLAVLWAAFTAVVCGR